MSIIDLYSAESWSISTALCVLSGSFSVIVWNCCWWAPGRRNCPVESSRPSDQRQRRLDDRKCWAGNVVWSHSVEWLTVTDVGWKRLRLVYKNHKWCHHIVTSNFANQQQTSAPPDCIRKITNDIRLCHTAPVLESKQWAKVVCNKRSNLLHVVGPNTSGQQRLVSIT